MKKVILESPYGNPDGSIVQRNIEYARKCIRDCLQRGESPLASHLLFTQDGILDDSVFEERALGIEAGLEWVENADYTVVYTDYGISHGMKEGIERALQHGKTVYYREIL